MGTGFLIVKASFMVNEAMKNRNKRHVRILSEPICSRVFEVVGPYKMQERTEEISYIEDDYLLLKTRLTGICHADLR
ncbi:MAG: hypothetical protein QXI71_04950, partial [Candidatus Bathyarchaeia archaeon]